MKIIRNYRTRILFAHLIFNISITSQAVINQIPEPEDFIIVNSNTDRPLGSSYTPKYISSRGNNLTQDFSGNTVLVHQDDSQDGLSTIIEKTSNNYNSLKLRNTESSYKSKVATKGEACQKELGEFLFNIQDSTSISSKELTLDLFTLISPFHESIDIKKSKYKDLFHIEKYNDDDKFIYKCSCNVDNRMRNYDCSEAKYKFRPAKMHADMLLTMCGTHVIARQYYGVSYRVSIKLNFQNEEDKKKFSNKIKPNLDKIYNDSKVSAETEIFKEIEEMNASWEVSTIDRNYTKFLKVLKKQDYDNLYNDFIVKNGALLHLNETSSNLSEILKSAGNLLQVLQEISSVSSELEIEDSEKKELFPVIAVVPDGHQNFCSSSFMDLNFALTLAWNKVTKQQCFAEKKEKGKKL